MLEQLVTRVSPKPPQIMKYSTHLPSKLDLKKRTVRKLSIDQQRTIAGGLSEHSIIDTSLLPPTTSAPPVGEI